MGKTTEFSKEAAAAETVKTETRCQLCFKPVINGVHENGFCSYERLIDTCKKNGGISIWA